MSPRKRRPVLFEVAKRPPAAREQAPRPAAPPRDPRHLDPVDAVDAPPPDPIVEPEPDAPAPHDEQFQLILKLPALLIGSAALLVLLAVTFAAGRQYGMRALAPADNQADGELASLLHDEQRNDDEQGLDQTPAIVRNDNADAQNRSAPNDDRNADQAAPAPQRSDPPAVELTPGLHYVVVQHFPKSKRSDALKAARYLRTNDIPVAMDVGPDIRLIVTRGFAIDSDERNTARAARREADRLVARVKQLGQDYAREGYTFEGAYTTKIAAP